ncbi:MAG TPA: 16S rRNA (uracil(1498)-N(3))-methyltransferase [Candidatus Deferrimicrobium sp.]|nr:16S rRNA (uracil(1498)-N(3))-methyltransferase [Candidatus Deferrimicrobium sp.]
MPPPVFYCPPDLRRGNLLELPLDENHHAANVLRLRQGEPVVVVDGMGMAYEGEIYQAAASNAVKVKITSEIPNFGEPVLDITLAAGLSAGFKFDTVVEKGTELGVKRFVPIVSERSRIKLVDTLTSAGRIRRIERVALAAMKQCRRSFRPEVLRPVTLDQFLPQADSNSLRLVFHPSPDAVLFGHLKIEASSRSAILLVGPESGFSPEEVALACDAGFIMVRLGPRILRTETAGPVACALVMQLLGEFT